jgi:hypothetical protein
MTPETQAPINPHKQKPKKSARHSSHTQILPHRSTNLLSFGTLHGGAHGNGMFYAATLAQEGQSHHNADANAHRSSKPLANS